VAYEIAPHQNGMVAIMIPQIRFSDRPLNPSKSQQKDKNITLFTPFGLILREEMTLNPTIID
jgi:hypothetical protein